MAQATNIEWTDQSWNFLRGCRRVSPGCENCYAERQAIRHAGPGGSYEGLVKSTPSGPRWTGKLSFHEDILLAPLKRRTPTKYFVNSMSDLFYEDVTDEMLDKAFAVMALCPQHIFQILTKRPERMRKWFADRGTWPLVTMIERIREVPDQKGFIRPPSLAHIKWPLPNVWLGVSVENQEYADKRIPLLLNTPAAVRWISAEPLLGPIRLDGGLRRRGEAPKHVKALVSHRDRRKHLSIGATHYLGEPIGLDWVVVGGESGPRSRSCDLHWIRTIVADCKFAEVPVFVKQLGGNLSHEDLDECQRATGTSVHDRKGGAMSEWPEDMRVREFPNATTTAAKA